MKQREKTLAEFLLDLCDQPYDGGFALDTIGSDKQLHYYLDKWTQKGWWNYGVTARSGWWTPEGIEYFKKLLLLDSFNAG